MTALVNQRVFLKDVVKALYKVGKELDWMWCTVVDEFTMMQQTINYVTEANMLLPSTIRIALRRLQEHQTFLLKNEQKKIGVA